MVENSHLPPAVPYLTGHPGKVTPSLQAWAQGGGGGQKLWESGMVQPSPLLILSFQQKGPFPNQPCQPRSVQQTPLRSPSFLGTLGVTYIENEEGVGTAVELCQLAPDLVHEVAVTWVACDTGGVARGDGKGAPRPVFPVQNQQQGHDSWEEARSREHKGGEGQEGSCRQRSSSLLRHQCPLSASSSIFTWPGCF